MPEVWLAYGAVDAVLDVRAENMGAVLAGSGEPLDARQIGEALLRVDMSKSPTFVLLQDTAAVRRTVSALYDACEGSSLPFPRMAAAGSVRNSIKSGLPQGSEVGGYGNEAPDGDLVFVYETRPDGLFGYATACSALLRMFGRDAMLEAYAHRDADGPLVARATGPYRDARRFADRFEVTSVEVTGCRGGVTGVWVGHPSKYDPAGAAGQNADPAAGAARAVVGSAGRSAGNDTLAACLPALWNMLRALRPGGQAALLAECAGGLGSPALSARMEGGMAPESAGSPSEYVEGMEDVLFLDAVSAGTEITLVSALPDFYASRLNLRTARRAQDALDAMIRGNPRRKVSVVRDASCVALREDAGGDGGAEDG